MVRLSLPHWLKRLPHSARNHQQANRLSRQRSRLAGIGLLRKHLLIDVLEERTMLSASFQGLGSLPGGMFYSMAEAVASDGSVVVGQSNSARGMEGFQWTPAGGMVGLGFLPGDSWSESSGVAAAGSVIVGTSSGFSASQAYRWTPAGGMMGLGFLPGYNQSIASAVSADGVVVVGVSSGLGPNQAYRWTQAGGMAGLGFLPGGSRFSDALSVSTDGSVIVGVGDSSSSIDGEAFRWIPATGMVGLGFLPGGSQSFANSVSADGSVVVGEDHGQAIEAFRWTPSGGMVGLGFLPAAPESRALSVSADGSIVVGEAGDQLFENGVAFIWDGRNGMRPLQDVLMSQGVDLTGWVLRRASAISADGNTIVGDGLDPAGRTEAWIAHLGVTAPTITCSVAQSLLWPPNHRLVQVGLSVAVDPPDANLHLVVYANDHADASDAADIAPETLRLRAERQGHGLGRVYLIVATATNSVGSAFDVCSVVVPHSNNSRSIDLVRREALFAEGWYRHFQTAPPDFHRLGEGPGSGGGAPASGQTGRSPIPGDLVRLHSPARATPLVSLSHESLVGTVAASVPAEQFLFAWESLPADGSLAAAHEEAFRLMMPPSEPEGQSEATNLTLDLVLRDAWLTW
jgi:probable HAF family extracellular repeat protein